MKNNKQDNSKEKSDTNNNNDSENSNSKENGNNSNNNNNSTPNLSSIKNSNGNSNINNIFSDGEEVQKFDEKLKLLGNITEDISNEIIKNLENPISDNSEINKEKESYLNNYIYYRNG